MEAHISGFYLTQLRTLGESRQVSRTEEKEDEEGEAKGERERKRESKQRMKINKMMEGDTGAVSSLSRSRWPLLDKVGRGMRVQTPADSLQSHGRAVSPRRTDCLSDYLSGITQANVTITTGPSLPIINHLQ